MRKERKWALIMTFGRMKVEEEKEEELGKKEASSAQMK